MSVLDDAIAFAVEAHKGMVRKSAKSPYILHPLETATIVGTMTDDPEVLAAAVLHDVVEDTGHTLSEVRERFGDRVADLVAAETENKRKDLPPAETWRLRKEESFAELEATDDIDVKRIWLGDKLSNMRSFYRSHLACGDEFWKDFHQKDPSEQHWYYARIAELLDELSDTPAWQEYVRLLGIVFEGSAQ